MARLEDMMASVRRSLTWFRGEDVPSSSPWHESGTHNKPVATIAINMRPTPSPWGGGNQWLNQIVPFLQRKGYAVRFDLHESVDCVILADPRLSGTVTFGVDDIKAHRRRYPHTLCIHRINENDQRKNTDFMDKLLGEANVVSDHTIFISEWLRDYHAKRWFGLSRPHTVISNGADDSIYHPGGSAEFAGSHPLRLVTHHWSDNMMKGFPVYVQIDERIADGKLPGTEFWVIGRWPKAIRWRAARSFAPTHGGNLAQLLRQCHVYVTASLWEPGGMHFIEGAQCGLPLLYHLDGGGIVEVASRFGVGFRDDVEGAIGTMREQYPELRRRVLSEGPTGAGMCSNYLRVIDTLLCRNPSADAPAIT
jgi:glycosyltransferase involved in cell wall biosynthesis